MSDAELMKIIEMVNKNLENLHNDMTRMFERVEDNEKQYAADCIKNENRLTSIETNSKTSARTVSMAVSAAVSIIVAAVSAIASYFLKK